MKKIYAGFVFLLLFSSIVVQAAVIPDDYSQGDSLPYDELNQIKNERIGDIYPIDATSREYVDGTEDLGSGTYQWNSLYLDNTIDFGTPTIGQSGGNLIFNDAGADVDHRFEASGVANAFFIEGSSGKVGIGTNSPNYIQTSYKASDPIIQLINSASGTTASDGLLIHLAGSEARFNMVEAGPMTFYTSNSERMRIDSSGNLGIGVTPESWNTALRSLQIGGNTAIYGTNTAGSVNNNSNFGNNVYFDAGGQKHINSDEASMMTLKNGTFEFTISNGSQAADAAYAGTVAMKIDNDGNVGIGTTSPDTQLEIESTSTQLKLTHTAGADEFTFGVDSNGDGTIASTGGDISFSDEDLSTDGDITVNGAWAMGTMSMGAGTELTISGGVITVDTSYHSVDTQSDAASDDLDTINGAVNLQILILRNNNNARTVVVKHGTGNIALDGGADFSMNNVYDRLFLQWTGAAWVEISRSNNG